MVEGSFVIGLLRDSDHWSEKKANEIYVWRIVMYRHVSLGEREDMFFPSPDHKEIINIKKNFNGALSIVRGKKNVQKKENSSV